MVKISFITSLGWCIWILSRRFHHLLTFKLDSTLHRFKISKDMMKARVTFKGQTHSFKSCFITDFFLDIWKKLLVTNYMYSSIGNTVVFCFAQAVVGKPWAKVLLNTEHSVCIFLKNAHRISDIDCFLTTGVLLWTFKLTEFSWQTQLFSYHYKW